MAIRLPATTQGIRPTNGCVRISNAHQLLLQNNITSLTGSPYHYGTGNIYISEN